MRGTRLSAFPKGLHRVVEDVQVCEAGKVDEEIAHLNSKLEISGAGRLLVSAPGRRGRLVGVNLASIDLAGRGRDLRCADRRAEVGSPAMVRDARERTPPLGCFNTLENRFNTSGSVPQPPCKDAVSNMCNLRPSSPVQSSRTFLPTTASMSLLVGLFELESPKKVFTPARSGGKLVSRKTELPILALPASPLTGL